MELDDLEDGVLGKFFRQWRWLNETPSNHNEEISVYVAGRSDCVNFLYLGLRRRCNSHTNGSTCSHCNAGSPNSDPCAERDSQAYCAPPSYGNSYYYYPHSCANDSYYYPHSCADNSY